MKDGEISLSTPKANEVLMVTVKQRLTILVLCPQLRPLEVIKIKIKGDKWNK